jgi:hypothetical protein
MMERGKDERCSLRAKLVQWNSLHLQLADR